jgi:hypothetical protein
MITLGITASSVAKAVKIISAATSTDGTKATVNFSCNMANPAGYDPSLVQIKIGGVAQTTVTVLWGSDHSKYDITLLAVVFAHGDVITMNIPGATFPAEYNANIFCPVTTNYSITNNVPA